MNSYNKMNIKFLSVVSYIGPLFVIGKFSYEKDSDQVNFHYRQGEILFFTMSILILSTIIFDYILNFISDSLSIICFLLKIGISVTWVILSIMGVISAISGSKTYLPIVGSLLKKISNKEV